MSDQRLGVCVVGAGELGTWHAGGWGLLEEARIVSVADLIPERTRKLADASGAGVQCSDYRDAILASGVDVVSVAVPAASHPEVAIFALEHGKHVLCEKPIALTLADAYRMEAAAVANGVHLYIGLQLRHSKWAQSLRDIIQRGEIGHPIFFRANQAIPIRAVVGKPAMHDARFGNGGPVVDVCGHNFDLWRYILRQDPTRVTARGFTFAAQRPELSEIDSVAPDTAAIIVEYGSAGIGTFNISWGLPPTVRGASMDDVLGPLGSVELCLDGMVLRKENGVETRFDLPRLDAREAKEEEIRHFADVILKGVAPAVTPGDAAMALSVSLGAIESMRTGQSVLLCANGRPGSHSGDEAAQ